MILNNPARHLIATLFAALTCMLSGCSSYHYNYAPIDPPEQNQ